MRGQPVEFLADIGLGGNQDRLLVQPVAVEAARRLEQGRDLIGKPIPNTAAEDSVSMLPAFLGTAEGPLREATVHHSINGSFAIRQGKWKLAFCPGSGG